MGRDVTTVRDEDQANMVPVMSADSTRAAGRPTSDRLADSAITLIARDGLDALSVRRVAAEASLSGGTVQHHFPTKNHLTVAAFDRAVQRQTERVAVVPRGERPLVEHFIAQLCAILPDADPSVEEAIVWIAMSAAVPAQPVVAERQRRAVATTRSVDASPARRGAGCRRDHRNARSSGGGAADRSSARRNDAADHRATRIARSAGLPPAGDHGRAASPDR